jgi:hypothetical protein
VRLEELLEGFVIERVAPILPIDREQRHRPAVLEVDHRRAWRVAEPWSSTAAS